MRRMPVIVTVTSRALSPRRTASFCWRRQFAQVWVEAHETLSARDVAATSDRRLDAQRHKQRLADQERERTAEARARKQRFAHMDMDEVLLAAWERRVPGYSVAVPSPTPAEETPRQPQVRGQAQRRAADTQRQQSAARAALSRRGVWSTRTRRARQLSRQFISRRARRVGARVVLLAEGCVARGRQ